MTVTSPDAPPLRETLSLSADPSSPAPAPKTHPVDINVVAEAIAASEDPTAMLTHLLFSVSARTATAPEQGVMLSKIGESCAELLKRVRATLLASVNQTPGSYPGFEVVARSGSRRVDYERLQNYPDVYTDVVTVGPPTMAVRYTTD